MTRQRKGRALGVKTNVDEVSAAEFKARCLELVGQVRERGVEYVVTRHGRPVAKLVPADDAPTSAIGFLRGTVVDAGDIVSPDPAAWEAPSADPLDRS
jgi:prevent-host-death family protein